MHGFWISILRETGSDEIESNRIESNQESLHINSLRSILRILLSCLNPSFLVVHLCGCCWWWFLFVPYALRMLRWMGWALCLTRPAVTDANNNWQRTTISAKAIKFIKTDQWMYHEGVGNVLMTFFEMLAQKFQLDKEVSLDLLPTRKLFFETISSWLVQCLEMPLLLPFLSLLIRCLIGESSFWVQSNRSICSVQLTLPLFHTLIPQHTIYNTILSLSLIPSSPSFIV